MSRTPAPLLARSVVALAVISCTALAVQASEEGHRAADKVAQDSYRNFLDVYLYTHNGHNRGRNGPQHDPARDNIRALLESYGYEVEFDVFTYSGGTYENVVATKWGTLVPDQEYVVGAHYDSVNNPGADDNASGVGLVLECARVLGPYKSDATIRLIAFDVEEAGLVGSEHYVSVHGSDDIRGMISADMIAYDPNTNGVDIYGRSASSAIKNAVAAAIVEYGDGLIPSIQGRFDASDHVPFEARGFQACLFSEGEGLNNPNYHTQWDSFDTANYLNFPYATKMTRSIVGWLVDYAGVNVLDYLPGDMNCDGAVDFGDVNPFVLALSHPDEYALQFPDCDIQNADANGDGEVNFADINAFVELLINS